MTQGMLDQIKEQLRIPVIMAPMFLISNPLMVINACKAGIIGTFPALNARTSEILDEWMAEINDELEGFRKENPQKRIAPWGINIICNKSNTRFKEDLQLIEKYQPSIVITSLGDPSQVVQAVHHYNGLVFSDVIDVKFARKALEKGSDGLVLVTSGAGGHGGTLNPIAFLHEIRSFFDGPIILGGSMSRGEDVLAAELLGADFSYFGTRFIAAQESGADEDYKNMIVESSIEDIIYTSAFSGVPANFLIPSIIKSGIDPNELPEKEAIDFSKLKNPNIRAWKDIFGAGQGVGGVQKIQSVADITEELYEQYLAAQGYVVNKYKEFANK